MSGDVRVARVHDLDFAVDQRGDIGGCTANIHGDDVLLAIQLSEVMAADHPAGGTGH
ncbi:hypothetical protein D3C84_658380 [compost metagenome]